MFDAKKTAPIFKNLLGWRQHYDTNEISLPVEMTLTDTGEYFQQKHPALRLDIIQSILPNGKEISQYLNEKVQDASVEMLNDLIQQRHLNKYGKTLLNEVVLLNKYGFLSDKIINEGRFVGLQIKVETQIGLQALISQIGLQFYGVENFKLYLFHSSKKEPIKEFDVKTDGSSMWSWTDTGVFLNGLDNEFKGGVFLLGYYQDDVVSNAINNTDFNFDRGVCGTCNKSFYNDWQDLNNYFTVYPFYVAKGDYTIGEMFDLRDINYVSDVSYGLNLKLSVRCDLTSFFMDNRFVFKNLLSLNVVRMILRDMQFSQEINYIEENLKMMIIRDLEGDKETKKNNITQEYQNELKAVEFNISNINSDCLPCENNDTYIEYDYV